MALDTFKQIGATAKDESVGKVFVVVGVDARKCLVCDKAFTRQASLQHSMVMCCPATKRSLKTNA